MSGWPAALPDAKPAAVDVQALSRCARSALAAPNEPVLIARACELAGARVRSDRITVGARAHSAMLVPAEPGFTILLSRALRHRAASESSARRWARFVLAHELGHTFFYRPGRRPTRFRRPDAAEESFCHRFATSLLVPPTAADRTPVTLTGLRALAARYDVALWTAAWAVCNRRSDTSILWLRHGPHPRSGDRQTLRIQWAASERFFARGESLKSRLVDLGPGEHATNDECLKIGGRRERLTLEAWRFPTAMLAVLHHGGLRDAAARRPARAQLRLDDARAPVPASAQQALFR